MTRPRQIHVLLLSESESMAALDRRALREVGVDRIEGLTSGVAAARMLAGLDEFPPSFKPDVVICSQRLSDMDGEQFCAILRLHPLLLDMPVLLILPHDSEVEQLRTLGCGASALISRPYSFSQLKAHLDFLANSRSSLEDLEKAAHLADTKAFDEAVATYGILLKPIRQPEDYFRVGMQCLEQRKWNSAINAFQRAMRGALIQGKAELGMAAAWKGKGDMARYRHYLSLAAATFVRARQWNRARAVYARMLQEDPTARSPFLSEALQQIRQGNFDFAAGILAQGYEITPREQISERMAQICLATDTPDDMLKSMEACLEQALGADAEALSAEIRTTLETLTREAEAKKLEDAAERQWRAGRQASRERGDAEGAPAEWANDPLMQVGQAQMGQAQTNQAQAAGADPQRAPITAARQRGQIGIALADEDEPDMSSQQGSAARSGALRAGQGASSPVISLWGEHEGAAQSTQNTRTTQDAQPAISGNTPIPPLLDPLARGKSSGSLIGGKSSLTDMMSIVKFTWKQAFRK
ncbi:MAG TPA: response regulator [Desulfovibrio sp.]|uniref:response regulator n=1 Tax=Desulfovibrio sp. TaxID=885 RepID=UPI002D281DC3|nr:response regulator [Desulfovibrio sp.]HZF60830.1 response regulator [Desulfovibrio sp.]